MNYITTLELKYGTEEAKKKIQRELFLLTGKLSQELPGIVFSLKTEPLNEA